MTDRRGTRRAVRWAASGAVLLVAVAAGWWAGQATLSSPPEASSADDTVVVAVTEATVGQSITFNVTVSQPFGLVASNALPGVVTSVSASELQVGDAAYAVAGFPVRVVQGSVPFYRDLVAEAEGVDVTQLQEALVTLGYLGQSDGSFGARTTRAVRAWQRATGVEETGVVRLGEVVAVPSLPAAIRLDEAIEVGAVLSGGERAVLARVSEPSFALVVSSDQAASIPVDAVMQIGFEGETWPAIISATETREGGETAFALSAPDGSIVCGSSCGALPPEETVSLLAQVQLTPEASGPGVPVAAVRTAADGTTYVLDASGQQRPVEVVASGDGIAVVSGVDVGDRVLAVGSSPDDASTPD